MASIGWGTPSNTLDKYLNVNTQPTIPSAEPPPNKEPIEDVGEWHQQKMEVDAIRKMSDDELLQRYQSAKAEQERIASLSDEDLLRQYQEAKASLLSSNPQEPKEAMGGFEYLRKRWEADGVNFTGPEWKKNLDATLMALTPFLGKITRIDAANSLGNIIGIAKGEFDINDKFIQDRFHDQLLAYRSGLDDPETAKKRVQSEAMRWAIAMAESRQAIQNEISERGTTTMGTIFGKGSEIVGQAGEMLVPGGLATKFAVGAGTEAASRYAEHANGKIGYDENGNPVILDGDSAGKAAGEALLGGGAQSGIELLGGKVLGKVWGATGGKLIGKAAGTAVGQKVAENSIVKGVGKITNLLKTPLEITGWSGMPGEIGEEFMQGATDAYFGLDTTDAEERGTTAGGRFKKFAGDFFKGENLADLAESMLLMQAIGGGSAYLQKRHSNKQLNKIITEEIGGVSENVLNKLSVEEKARIIEAHYQGLSAEEAADIINKGAGALDKFMIEKQTAATQSANGRAMLAEMNPEAADAIRAARREGKDISRKMIRDLGLSEKVLGDVESRNKFGDALLEDDRKLAAKNAAKMDGQQEMALRQEIAGFVGDTPEAQRVFDRVTMKLKDASVLDDPYQREKLVMQAAEAVYAEDQAQRIGGARQKARMAEKADHEARMAEKADHEARLAEERAKEEARLAEERARSKKGQEERAKRRREMKEYEAQEKLRIQRELEEQDAPKVTANQIPIEETPTPKSRAEEWPEYVAWIKRNGLKDSDKNWNKFVAQNDLDPNLKVDRGRNINKESPNETRTNETPAQPEQAAQPVEGEGEAARPMEAGKAPSEVGGEVAATQPAVGASTSASAETKANTPPITAESVKGGSQAADAASTPMKPKTVKEGKAFVNSNIGKRYTDGKKTYEITGLTKDGEVSVKVTDKIGKSSETTLKLSGTLTNIFGTNKKSAVWSEVKDLDSAKTPQSRTKTTAKTPKTEVERNESGSKAEVKKPTKPIKANPKKAAEVVKEFVSKDKKRSYANRIHHDHDSGLVVATNGSILIATKHGYDPNYKDDNRNPYPNWRQVVPTFKKGEGQTITIDPNAVLEATKTVKKLASGIKSDNMIRIKLPNGEHTYMSVNTLSRVAKAMAANGITDITTKGPFKPLLAKNNDTTIVAMPLRNGDGDVKLGRNDGTKIVTFDLESGKVISAPESKIGKMRRGFAEKLRADIAEGRTKEIEWLRTTELYKGLIAAQKKGETDAKKVYEGITREEGSWDNLSEANKKLFAELLATKDIAELENRFSEYSAKMKDSKKQSPQNDWVERTPKELAKLEKEIAAEDAIDAMMADAEPKTAPKSEPKGETKAESKKEEKVEPKSEPTPSIIPAEAMKKLGTLGAADVDTLTKAMHREERLGHTERANMIRVLRDYKRGVGTNSNPQSDETSGGKYRASVESAKPLDDPAFVAWAKKRGVAPTTQKRNEYDKAMADTLKNRLSRWIKGVTVEWVNFIAPEDGGDVKAAKKITPAVTEASGHHSEGASQAGLSSLSVVAPNRKPTASITPAEDAAYLDAVKRGDMETAQRMVRKAAAKAMPDTKVVGEDGLPLVVYHTSDWNPLSERDGNAVFDSKKIKEGSLGRVFYFSREQEGQYGKNTTKAYLNLKNPFNVDKDAGRVLSEKESERFYKALDGEVLGEYKPETMGELFAAFKDESTFPDAMRAIGYDGIVDEGRGYFGAFDSNQIKSVEITSKGDRNVIPLSQRFNPENSDIRLLHDGERIVGSYNRATGEVKLAKGASVETVLHELGWHAARHWAEVNADSDPKAANLLKQMKEYAESAPEDVKKAVRDTYGEMSADTLLDEIGAARFTKEQSGRIAEALATKEGAAWYQKVWNKVVDFFKNFLTKIGYNRVDLGGIENMSPEVFGDFLADVMMSGKQLGERTAFSMDAPKGVAAKWTNNHSDYKAPVAELEKRTTGSSNNIYYLARTLEGMAQRGKNRAERAIKRVKKILGDDISLELLAQYMQLKAYEERNTKIERRNNKKDASGMTPKDAKTIEKTIKDSGVDEAIFEEAAQILWDLQIEGLQARVDAGLLDNHTAVKWMIDEPHHIPWRDAIDPDSGEYVGRRVGASEFDTAEGRKTAASGDPITWMLQEYQDAMTRAAQNRLRSSIANLTRLNGDVGIIYDGIQTDSKGKRSFIKYPKKGSGGTAKVLSIPEGVKLESTVKNDGGMKNVLTFKEGGETKYLVLNGTLGEAVAGAVTGRTLSRPPAWISWVMRGYAATATSLSPAFAARNITADNFDIHNNLVAKYGWVKGEKMFGKVVKEQFLMTKQLGSYIKNGDFKLGKDGKITDFQKVVEAYEDAGGLIGGMATEGYDATVKKIQADFRAGRNKARSIGKSVATYWTMMQKMSELAPRLAVFKTAMESGMSAKEAAMLSRDITVDFNKKGAKTPWFNSLWMFSNSALGANLTQMKGLVGKTGLKLAGGLVMYGFAEGLLEALMNGDDDEREKEGLASGKDINEYTRQNSLYIRRGDKVFRVNIHMGPFAYAKYFGNVMARTFSGMISPEKAAKELGLTAAEVAASFTGLGNVSGDALVQTAVPTILQPIVQIATNKDYAGRAIKRAKYTESQPYSSHGRKSTPPVYHWMAKRINEFFGGNDYRKGKFLDEDMDIAPETVKVLTEMVGKNFARDIMEIAETGHQLLSGNAKDLDIRNVPFAGDVVRKQEGNDNRYYENYNRYRDDKHELEKQKGWTTDERRAYLKEHPWLYSAGKPGVTRIDNIVKRIKKLRDVEESDRATEERKAEAKATRRRLQARVIEIMKGK